MFLKYEYDEWGNLWLGGDMVGGYVCVFFFLISNKGSLCGSDMGWYGL